jgi:uncharacterized protein (TIGR02594 family)
MPKLSISYRRADSEAITGRIFDRLAAHYGKDAVFRDIDNIPAGEDFRDRIKEALQNSDILLAIVGPKWTGPIRGGTSRINEETDQVRIEIETALQSAIPVIPVLVGGGKAPKPQQLPASLKDFAFLNAPRVDSGQDFDVHVDRLIRDMDTILQTRRPGTASPRRWLMAGAIAAAAALLIGIAAAAHFAFSARPTASPRASAPAAEHAAAMPAWLAVAYREIGQEEIAGPQNNPRIIEYLGSVGSTQELQDDEVDWASAFVEWSLRQTGIAGPRSMEPSAWLNWGRTIAEPELGCVVVFSFKGLGHVGFYVKTEGNSLYILGGNQSDAVKISRYAKKDAIGYRVPAMP